MRGELLAGLAGGGVAILAGIVAQAFGAWLARRRRVRELASRYLATLKAVGYIAEHSRADARAGNWAGGLRALELQTQVIELGMELRLLAPRNLRKPTEAALYAAMKLLEVHRAVDDRNWRAAREAFSEVVQKYNLAMSKLD